MRRIRIYLDTSVINFLFADDAPEMKEITINFFENYVKPGVYDVCISPIVFAEINRTTDSEKRQRLKESIEKYDLESLNIDEDMTEIERPAGLYIENSIIPAGKMADALHIAIATVKEMDILLSWNFRHLANVNKEANVFAINSLEGYTKPLRMVTPMEVIYND